MSQSEKRFWWWALLVSTVAWLLFGRGAGASSSRAGGEFVLSQKQRDLIAASTSDEYKALVKAGAPVARDGSVKVPDPTAGEYSLKVTYMKPDGSISVVY